MSSSQFKVFFFFSMPYIYTRTRAYRNHSSTTHHSTANNDFVLPPHAELDEIIKNSHTYKESLKKMTKTKKKISEIEQYRIKITISFTQFHLDLMHFDSFFRFGISPGYSFFPSPVTLWESFQTMTFISSNGSYQFHKRICFLLRLRSHHFQRWRFFLFYFFFLLFGSILLSFFEGKVKKNGIYVSK